MSGCGSDRTLAELTSAAIIVQAPAVLIGFLEGVGTTLTFVESAFQAVNHQPDHPGRFGLLLHLSAWFGELAD